MSETLPAGSVHAITAALAAPFDSDEVKWKPAVVSGNRAMAIAYVDARVIQDRLDAVLGPEGWQDDYELLPDGTVVCRLRLRLGGEWITKVDVGGPSEQPDGGDRVKAAFSDALKRAAVKFGVGRYLYRLPAQWVDYDPQKKQFARTPALPAITRTKAASPRKSTRGPPPAPADAERCTEQQLAEIEALLRDSGANVHEFLEYYAIQAVIKLPACHFQHARGLLRKKLAKANGQGDAAPADPQPAISGSPPAATPAAAAGSASPGEEPMPALLRRLHSLLHEKGSGWKLALDWAEALPRGFQEPQSADEAADLALLVTRATAERILKLLTPFHAKER